jgi:putative Holliday junction resolvase
MTEWLVYCGIDYGTKRIGLAISDPNGKIASPLCAVPANGTKETVLARIIEAVREYDVGGWVIGLPLNMDGTEGGQAKASRRFGEYVSQTTGMTAHYWDERLSSHAADEVLSQADLTWKKKKARRDAVAAQVILQSFLDATR